MDAVQPVLGGTRAAAAADGLEIDPGLAASGRLPRADEGGDEAGAVVQARDPLRDRLRQGAMDQVDDALAGRSRPLTAAGCTQLSTCPRAR